MKHTVKKIVRALMVILVVLTTLSASAAPVNAKKEIVVINDFSENTALNYAEFNALRKGSINAVRENDRFYYMFETDQIIVKVPVEVFTRQDAGNDYSAVNRKLTDYALKKTGDTKEFRYIYKKSLGKKMFTKLGSDSYEQYSTYLCHLKLNCYMDTSETIVSRCEMYGQVLFTYNTKVQNYSVFTQEMYVTPSTTSQYRAALQRDNRDSIDVTVSPQFEFSVTQPGSDKVYLNTYYASGMGKSAKKVKDVRSFINDLKNYKEMYDSISAMVLNPSVLNAIDIVTSAVAFAEEKKGTEYNTGKSMRLSSDGMYTLDGTFKSPLPLDTYRDWIQFRINLSHEPTYVGRGGVPTIIEVRFDIN